MIIYDSYSTRTGVRGSESYTHCTIADIADIAPLAEGPRPPSKSHKETHCKPVFPFGLAPVSAFRSVLHPFSDLCRQLSGDFSLESRDLLF